MKCEDVRHAVFVYLDGDGGAGGRGLPASLDACPSCRAFEGKRPSWAT